MSMQLLSDLRASINDTEDSVLQKARKTLSLSKDTACFVYRKSLDTRKDKFSFVYTVAIETDLQDPRLRPFPTYEFPQSSGKGKTIPIVGFGPAGMFCAWILAKCGFKPLILERGYSIEQRVTHVESFWKGGELNPESNVQFGEGGAGTFSDGKLTTRINDPRCRKVLELFVHFGAPKEILTLAKPHIGTDRLRAVVTNLREDVIRMGGEIRFETKLTDLTIRDGALRQIVLNGEPFDTNTAVLAIGNGAVDTYRMLLGQPIVVEPKPFSVGFRAEHSQDALNRRTYGSYYGNPNLGAADYLFSNVTDKRTGEAVYSFCMCPGGQVVNASSLPNRLTTNGMSHYSRNGENANAAILASVHPTSIDEGLELQSTIEHNAWNVARGLGPASTGYAFLRKEAPDLASCPIRGTFGPGIVPFEIGALFPDSVANRLRDGFALFQKRILGGEPALLTAPETRTSAPLRILRDPETLQSVSVRGLYPCGEGAGYAGGIMSSAVDGIRIAEQIIRNEL